MLRLEVVALRAGGRRSLRAHQDCLERAGTHIGPLDTLIAVHAVNLGVTLVTNNVWEFE